MNKTHRIVLTITLTVLMTFTLVACGEEAADRVMHSIAQRIQGTVTGEIGKKYSTEWFEFAIESVEVVENYAGYSPMEGNKLVKIQITQTCTYDDPDPTPFGIFDWYMDSDSFDDYLWPLDPLDNTMMPEIFYLANGESATNIMIFEVDEDVVALKLIYTEEAEDGSIYATFIINIII